MHELSIVEGILRIVEERRRRHGFSKVTRVDLVCGEHNCVSEECLQFNFDIASASTCAAGARLALARVHEKHRCRACGGEFAGDGGGDVRCPSCASGEVETSVNRELYVRSLEVE